MIDYWRRRIISTGNYLSYASSIKKKPSRKKKWYPTKPTTLNYSKASGGRMQPGAMTAV